MPQPHRRGLLQPREEHDLEGAMQTNNFLCLSMCSLILSLSVSHLLGHRLVRLVHLLHGPILSEYGQNVQDDTNTSTVSVDKSTHGS